VERDVTPDDVPERRREELAANLGGVRHRIAVACAAADRQVADVELIAITKTFPAADVIVLAGLGLTEFGENRDQEAAPKAAEVARLAPLDALNWHFVGALQTNKCTSVVSYASLVHSVDRLRLVGGLGKAAAAAGLVLRCLVQIDLDDVSLPGRAGARPSDVAAVAAAIDAHPHLELAGVMAVAPLHAEAAAADVLAVFGQLARLADAVRQRYPAATVISAGMSGDLEAAVANGATHLRVGSALLGVRRHSVR
jgi:pyridoxal phosphate enzyme (YggS family)